MVEQITGVPAQKEQADWPHENIVKGEGCVRITGTYRDPDLGGRALGLGFLALIVTIVLSGLVPDDYYASTMVLWLIVPPITAFIAFVWWRPAVNVTIGPESVVIGGKTYSRDVDIQFRTDRHPRAIAALDRGRQPRPEYAQAMQVVMQYGERSVPIAMFRGRDIEMARALIIRLQAWHEGFNRLRRQPETEQPATTASDRDEFGPAPPIR
ncbi:MAG: hypothetical protein ACRED5_03790 [Propylenella sp.]